MESWAGPGNEAVKRWAFATVFRGGIKPGTEQNKTESNLCTLQTWLLDTGWKIGFKMPAYQCTGSWSHVLHLPWRQDKHLPWRQDKHPADSMEPFKYVKHSSCPPSIFVWRHQPLLTSEGSTMLLLSLGSAQSRAICGSPSNRKGVVSCSSVLSANTKQAPPESVYWHVNIWQPLSGMLPNRFLKSLSRYSFCWD